MKDFPLACYAVLLIVLMPYSAIAQDDIEALSLADQAPIVIQRARAWQAFSEVGLGQYRIHDEKKQGNSLRLSLDAQIDTMLMPGLQMVIFNRLDVKKDEDLQSIETTINTLKEAYFSWQPNSTQNIDIGRINARYGVGVGYNPNDFLRAGSVRSFTSVDPTSLKTNRLGSVMLRGQQLWSGGAIVAMYSPKLEREASDNIDFDGTNFAHRYMIATSTRLSDNIEPQLLLHGEVGKPMQLGFNLSVLATNATVIYTEWSGGRGKTTFASALNSDEALAFRHRAVLGISYTTSNKFKITAEYQFNGAGMKDQEWSNISRTNSQQYGRYRQWLQLMQELPTRNSLFLHFSQQDIAKSGVDMNVIVRRNLADKSQQVWVEARHNFPKYDVALQWQRNSGYRGSEFGSMPQKNAWQIVLKKYF